MKERATPRFTEDQLVGAQTSAGLLRDAALIAHHVEDDWDRSWFCERVDKRFRELARELGYEAVPLAEAEAA